MSALLLLLADGRLPAGGHAHSGGIEAAVAAGLVSDTDDLGDWLDGRLATAGLVDAAVAVVARRMAVPLPHAPLRPGQPGTPGGPDGRDAPGALRVLDAEASARSASPAVRQASRAQGRGLLRAARRWWPIPSGPPVDDADSSDRSLDGLAGIHPDGPLHPVVVGVVGATGGLTALDVATAALWSALSGPAWAAVRLLGLDPLEVAAVLARRSATVDLTAGDVASEWAAPDRPLSQMPAPSAPLLDIGAEAHAGWEVRLFAS